MRSRPDDYLDNPEHGQTSDPAGRWSVPSWVVSAVFHIILFLILALVFSERTPQGGSAPVRTAEVGIVIKRQTQATPTYDSPMLQPNNQTATTPATSASDVSMDEVFSDQPPSDPSGALPVALDVIGPAMNPGGQGEGSTIGLGAGDGGGSRGGVGEMGKGTTSIFGIPGDGYSFAYVFDRSASMGGSGRSALTHVKEHLLASIQSLQSNHQFHIIFYNQEPLRFNNSNELMFATDQNKRLAENFIRSVTAEGSTEHKPAILAGIAAQPDVIFFLTDADEPRLRADELAMIKRRAGDIIINAIEFGKGPQKDPDNFLVRLARECGGQHKYINMSQLDRISIPTPRAPATTPPSDPGPALGPALGPGGMPGPPLELDLGL